MYLSITAEHLEFTSLVVKVRSESKTNECLRYVVQDITRRREGVGMVMCCKLFPTEKLCREKFPLTAFYLSREQSEEFCLCTL